MKPAAASGVLLLFAALRADAQPTFKSNVDAVRLDVSVMRRDQPVVGLTAKDFTVLDNGAAQVIAEVTREEHPLSVTMVLDTSGSMAGEPLKRLVDAARGLLGSLRPEDTAALVTFGEDVELRLPLTRDRAAASRALDQLTAVGPTAMRDALWTALQLRPDDRSRPLVLLFSDGLDTTSWLSESDAVVATERAGTIVHVVELVEDRSTGVSRMPGTIGPVVPLSSVRPPTVALDKLARAGGGRKWSAASPGDLRELFTRAIGEMRGRYVVTFYPEGPPTPGWHALKVSVRGGGEITARSGYFVPEPQALSPKP
jgi:VWFA-related protein